MGDWIMVIEGTGSHGQPGDMALSEGEAASMMNDFIRDLKKQGHVVMRAQVVSSHRQMAHHSIVRPLISDEAARETAKNPE